MKISVKHIVKCVFIPSIFIVGVLSIIATSVIQPRYVLNLEMKSVDPVTFNKKNSSKLKNKLDSIAHNYSLTCVECDLESTYFEYSNGEIYLRTTFDERTATLFFSVSALNPEENTTIVEEIKGALFLRFKDDYINVSADRETHNYSNASKKPYFEIYIKPPWKTRMMVACNGIADLKLALSVVDNYFVEYMANTQFINCTTTWENMEFCRKFYTRSYCFGTITGANKENRSYSINVEYIRPCKLSIQLLEHYPDQTTNIEQMSSNIYKLLKQNLSEETKISISKRFKRY